MKTFPIIVAGSRNFDDYTTLGYVLDSVLDMQYDKVGDVNTRYNAWEETVEIISGCAEGADTLGEQFADEHGITKKRMPAEWKHDPVTRRLLNPGEGYARNTRMIEYVKSCGGGVLVAFCVNKSKGTMDIVGKALAAGLDVHVVQIKKEPK